MEDWFKVKLCSFAVLQFRSTAKLIIYKITKIPVLVNPFLYLCTDFEFEELNVLSLLWAKPCTCGSFFLSNFELKAGRLPYASGTC